MSVACTRANPAFGRRDSGTGSADSSAGTTGDAPPVGDSGSSGGGHHDASSTEGAPGSEAESGPDPGTSAANDSDGVVLCAGEVFVERTLVVTLDGEPDHPGGCPPATGVVGVVTASADADLRLVPCPACDGCMPSVGEYRFKTDAIPMPVIAPGTCVEVVAGRTADCALRSIAITDLTGAPTPVLVSATDTLTLPPTAAFPAGLEVPQVERLCGRDGCPDTGDYTLGFGDASHEPGTQTAGVALFESPFEFTLSVVQSEIDGDCEPRVAWDAWVPG